MNISTKLTFGNILFGCSRQVGCLIEVTANTGLTVVRKKSACLRQDLDLRTVTDVVDDLNTVKY